MTELTAAEARILDALDVPLMVASLVELVRVPSVTGTDAESELQHRQAGSLADLGFDVDEWKLDLDALRADPAFPGTEAPRTEGYGVAATYGEGAPALGCRATSMSCRRATSTSGRIATRSRAGSSGMCCMGAAPVT